MEEKITRENVAERFKKARKIGHYSYMRASEEMGLTVQTLFNIEHGKHPRLNFGTLAVVAQFIYKVEENGKDNRSEV